MLAKEPVEISRESHANHETSKTAPSKKNMPQATQEDQLEPDAVRRIVRAVATQETAFEVLHRKGSHTVVRYPLAPGQTVVVKLWSQEGVKHTLRALLRIRPADYEWTNLLRARELGLPCPNPLGRCSGPKMPGAFTDAIVLEDLGSTEPAITRIKSLIASGDEDGLRALEDGIIALTSNLAQENLYDTDLGVLNISVRADGHPVMLDFEMVRKPRLPFLRDRLLGRMLGRLLLTYTFAVQPRTERVLRFADRLRSRIDPSRAALKGANAYLQSMLAKQAENPALDFKVPLDW